MKIKWLKSSLYEPKEILVSCSLGEFIFLMSPLTTDFYSRLAIELPVPQVQKEFARDSKGKLEKDEKGNVLRVEIESDEKYKREMQEIQNLQSIAMIYESLRFDPSIEFEGKRNDFKTAKEFFRAIEKEINDMFPMPLYLALLDSCSKKNIPAPSIEEAKKNSR